MMNVWILSLRNLMLLLIYYRLRMPLKTWEDLPKEQPLLQNPGHCCIWRAR